MKKRVLCCILALCMLCSLAPMPAIAAPSNTGELTEEEDASAGGDTGGPAEEEDVSAGGDTGGLTEEEAEAMAEALAGLEENPKPLTMEDLVRDYGVMPPMMTMSASQDNDREARGLTLIQNEDNENNERTHTPDNDLDRIPRGGTYRGQLLPRRGPDAPVQRLSCRPRLPRLCQYQRGAAGCLPQQRYRIHDKP